MPIRYVLKNKRGNYYCGGKRNAYSSDINRAFIFYKSAAEYIKGSNETEVKVDVQITEFEKDNG